MKVEGPIGRGGKGEEYFGHAGNGLVMVEMAERQDRGKEPKRERETEL